MVTAINPKTHKGKKEKQCKEHFWIPIHHFSEKFEHKKVRDGCVLMCQKCLVKTTHIYDLRLREIITSSVEHYIKWKKVSKKKYGCNTGKCL